MGMAKPGTTGHLELQEPVPNAHLRLCPGAQGARDCPLSVGHWERSGHLFYPPSLCRQQRGLGAGSQCQTGIVKSGRGEMCGH